MAHRTAPQRRTPRTPADAQAAITNLQVRRLLVQAMGVQRVPVKRRRTKPARIITEPAAPQPISQKEAAARRVIADAKRELGQRMIASTLDPLRRPYQSASEIAAAGERAKEQRLALAA